MDESYILAEYEGIKLEPLAGSWNEAELQALAGRGHVDWLVDVSCSHSRFRSSLGKPQTCPVAASFQS